MTIGALHTGLGREQNLLEHERSGRHNARHRFDLLGDGIVIAHAILHPILHDDMEAVVPRIFA